MSDYWGIPLLMKFQHGHFRAFLSHTDVVPAFSGVISAWSWLLMVLDVALPFGPRHFGNPCCFCISNSDPHHFPRCFRSTGSSTSVGWENLQETPMFHGKIMCNPLFPVKIFPPQSIHWSTGNSFHFKIWVYFFKVTRAIPGLPWTQDWVNVLRGVDQFIWKHLKTKDFSRRQELWVWSIWQRLTAFDSVWLRLTLLRDYSIGECDPTWHNM